MEQEDRERLKRILELTEKNHKMVRKMYSTMRWGNLLKVVYWIVIVGVAVGAFYFLQPFLQSVQQTYKDLQVGVDGIRGTFSTLQEDVETVRDHIPE